MLQKILVYCLCNANLERHLVMEPRKNFNIQFDKLYLRVTALLNGREVHYDYVISPNADDLTDEKADLMKQELSESLLKDLPAGTKILSTEFIPETEMIAPIFDGDRVTSWRFLDYVANILSPEPDMNGNLHPKFTPLAVVRVMVDEDVSLIQLEERERIRIMVGNYVMELTKSPIYTIQQITPDDYWRILKGIGVMRNFPTSQRILVKVVSLAELKRCTERRRKRFEENGKG